MREFENSGHDDAPFYFDEPKHPTDQSYETGGQPDHTGWEPDSGYDAVTADSSETEDICDNDLGEDQDEEPADTDPPPERQEAPLRPTDVVRAVDRDEPLAPATLEQNALAALGPRVAAESVVIGSSAVYMTLDGEARPPRDVDIMVPPQAFQHLRNQPGWEAKTLPSGAVALTNGQHEVAVNDGTWPSRETLQEVGWKTPGGLHVAGLQPVYGWKQERDAERDQTDTAAIRKRLLSPDLPPLPEHVMRREIEMARSTLPEHLRDDPETQLAIRLAANGIYTVTTLYGDPALRRANEIIGTLEQNHGAIATYHHGFDLVATGQRLQEHFDNTPGVTKQDRLDGMVAETYSDASYGNGRASNNLPGGHDELRSANLARAHALRLGYDPLRAQVVHDAIRDTEFDEATGRQRGQNSSSLVGRGVAGVDLQNTVDADSVEVAFDLSVENGTSARWSSHRLLGRTLAQHGVRISSTRQAMEFIDAHPDARPHNMPDRPTVRQDLINQLYGSADFRDPNVTTFGYQPVQGWTLDNPEARVQHAQELRAIATDMQEGRLTAVQAYERAQRYTERLRAQQRRNRRR